MSTYFKAGKRSFLSVIFPAVTKIHSTMSFIKSVVTLS